MGLTTATCTTNEHNLAPPPKLTLPDPIRALLIQPGNSRALVRRAQAYQELGFFRLSVEDLEAAEASVSAEMRHICRQGEETGRGRAEACSEELAEVVRRLGHARWTKVRSGWRFRSGGGSGSSDAILEKFAQKEGTRYIALSLWSFSRSDVNSDASLPSCCVGGARKFWMLRMLGLRGDCGTVAPCPPPRQVGAYCCAPLRRNSASHLKMFFSGSRREWQGRTAESINYFQRGGRIISLC